MIDQKTAIDLAIKANVIDSPDIDSIHIPQAYVDDLTVFANMSASLEREAIINLLKRFAENLLLVENERGSHVVELAISLIEDKKI